MSTCVQTAVADLQLLYIPANDFLEWGIGGWGGGGKILYIKKKKKKISKTIL